MALERSYEGNFFAHESNSAKSSSEVIMEYIVEKLKCNSVIDFGCGTGEWLNTAKLYGVNIVLGLDGMYADKYKVLGEEEFQGVDLTGEMEINEKFDLAISLEVAEHLPEESANNFIHNIVKCSDIVLFSAAQPHQGGTLHVNEQYPDYWVNIFQKYGYEIVDCIRKKFWNDPNVAFWYKQNMFIYCKKEIANSVRNLFGVEDKMFFFPAIHPEQWECTYIKKFIFPFSEIDKGSNICIYGAGDVGQMFMRQLKTTDFANVVLWCDSAFEVYRRSGLMVHDPKEISQRKWDKIVIAVEKECTAKDIEIFLQKMGCEPNQLIWKDPIIK